MANTTNFGWETPDDTDLVKDGAAAIRTLGGAIDTSLVDLKGGTTNQVLAKNSDTDMDFKWVADATGIPATIIDAKGDLIVGTAADTAGRLAVGTDGYTLVADSGETTGLKWAAATTSGCTLISRVSFSNVASQIMDNVFDSTYENYMIRIDRLYAATATDDLHIQFRYGSTTQSASYYINNYYQANPGVTSLSWANSSNSAQCLVTESCGDTTYRTSVEFNVYGVGQSSVFPRIIGRSHSSYSDHFNSFGGDVRSAQTYSGFLIKSSSSNIYGIVSVYGLAK